MKMKSRKELLIEVVVGTWFMVTVWTIAALCGWILAKGAI